MPVASLCQKMSCSARQLVFEPAARYTTNLILLLLLAIRHGAAVPNWQCSTTVGFASREPNPTK
jgi:hypothetical protein